MEGNSVQPSLSVCAEMSSSISPPWLTQDSPAVGRVLSSKPALPEWVCDRQKELSEAVEFFSGCADKSWLPPWATGLSTAVGKARCGGNLRVSPRAQLPAPVREQRWVLTHSAPLSSRPGPPPPAALQLLPLLCKSVLFSFTPVTHTPQGSHSAPHWGLLLEFLGKHWDPEALQPYPSHH